MEKWAFSVLARCESSRNFRESYRSQRPSDHLIVLNILLNENPLTDDNISSRSSSTPASRIARPTTLTSRRPSTCWTTSRPPELIRKSSEKTKKIWGWRSGRGRCSGTLGPRWRPTTPSMWSQKQSFSDWWVGCSLLLFLTYPSEKWVIDCGHQPKTKGLLELFLLFFSIRLHLESNRGPTATKTNQALSQLCHVIHITQNIENYRF